MLSFFHNYFLLITLHLCIKSTKKIGVIVVVVEKQTEARSRISIRYRVYNQVARVRQLVWWKVLILYHDFVCSRLTTSLLRIFFFFSHRNM